MDIMDAFLGRFASLWCLFGAIVLSVGMVGISFS